MASYIYNLLRLYWSRYATLRSFACTFNLYRIIFGLEEWALTLCHHGWSLQLFEWINFQFLCLSVLNKVFKLPLLLWDCVVLSNFEKWLYIFLTGRCFLFLDSGWWLRFCFLYFTLLIFLSLKLFHLWNLDVNRLAKFSNNFNWLFFSFFIFFRLDFLPCFDPWKHHHAFLLVLFWRHGWLLFSFWLAVIIVKFIF